MRAQVASLRSPVRLGYEWPLPRHLQMRRAVKMLDEVVYRLIREGRARGTDTGDVLSILLLARDEEEDGLTDKQVRDEVMTLLLAGHETTANALTWTWYELAHIPACSTQLAAEVEPLGRPITVDDLDEAAVQPRRDRGGDAPASAGVHDRPRDAAAGRRSAGHELPEGRDRRGQHPRHPPPR